MRRVELAEALERLGRGGDLLALARDPTVDDWVRAQAAEALERLGRTDDLLALARDPAVDDWVRAQAAEALERLGRTDDLLAPARSPTVDDWVRERAKETRAVYALPVDEETLTGEPVILEREGRPVAVVVPVKEYEAFKHWRETQEWEKRRRKTQEAFERERQAYEQLEVQLLDKYAGLYVAIRGREVIDSDPEEMTLVQRVYREHGHGPMYVRQVGAPLPVRRIVSPRDVQS